MGFKRCTRLGLILRSGFFYGSALKYWSYEDKSRGLVFLVSGMIREKFRFSDSLKFR